MTREARMDNMPICWPQNRINVKLVLYSYSLGLHPPSSMNDLLDWLNTHDSRWLSDARSRILQARAFANSRLW